MGGNPTSAARTVPQVRPEMTLWDLLSFFKCHLSLYIALTAVAGQVLARHRTTTESLVLGTWVLILSLGAGALNNVQDRYFDRKFARTCQRIMAREAISVCVASLLAILFIALALAGLYAVYGPGWPLGLGVLALVFYNGLYTPLKQQGHRALAMVPGTLAGMIPPAMGWTAVPHGLAVADPSGLVIFMVGLGVWQYPHYLLLALRTGEAGGPVHPRERRAEIVIWAALFSLSMAAFLCGGWITSGTLGFLILGLGLALPLTLSALLFWAPRLRELPFWLFTLAMLVYTVAILLDRC